MFLTKEDQKALIELLEYSERKHQQEAASYSIASFNKCVNHNALAHREQALQAKALREKLLSSVGLNTLVNELITSASELSEMAYEVKKVAFGEPKMSGHHPRETKLMSSLERVNNAIGAAKQMMASEQKNNSSQ